jgi:hypothetical protein
MAGPLVLLGPQRPRANAPDALARQPGEGPVVVLSAGWRGDETDDEPLRRHLGKDVVVLPLYTWFEVVIRELPELRAAYRARQDDVAELRRLHRMRLHPALAVVEQLLGASRGPLVDEALDQALQDLRRIDLQLLDGAARIFASHGRVAAPWEAQPVVSRLRQKATDALRSARAVVITGGHVAILLNRLQFFGVDSVLRELHAAGRPILAWSAGGMVLADRIVLYYDDPPDGPAFPELLDRGFGLVKGVVLLPHARQRLRLDDPRRVGLLATRFAPAVCLGLENGAWIDQLDGEWVNLGEPGTALRLDPDGAVRELRQVAQ